MNKEKRRRVEEAKSSFNIRVSVVPHQHVAQYVLSASTDIEIVPFFVVQATEPMFVLFLLS